MSLWLYHVDEDSKSMWPWPWLGTLLIREDRQWACAEVFSHDLTLVYYVLCLPTLLSAGRMQKGTLCRMHLFLSTRSSTELQGAVRKQCKAAYVWGESFCNIIIFSTKEMKTWAVWTPLEMQCSEESSFPDITVMVQSSEAVGWNAFPSLFSWKRLTIFDSGFLVMSTLLQIQHLLNGSSGYCSCGRYKGYFMSLYPSKVTG